MHGLRNIVLQLMAPFKFMTSLELAALVLCSSDVGKDAAWLAVLEHTPAHRRGLVGV